MIDPHRSRSLPAMLILHIAALWLMTPIIAFADNIRPVYLEIEELSSGKIRVVWKVPRGQGLPPSLQPSFPERYRIAPPQKKLKTNDAIIVRWEMIGSGEGLAGSQIRIDKLEQTTTDALVRIRLADGTVHRVVLRPTETATTIPRFEETKPQQTAAQSGLLQFIDRWRYGILFSAAFLLSFHPNARRRGIVLCTAAMITGALCGHAVGRLPDDTFDSRQRIRSESEATKVLQGLMLNTYRAFMLDQDEDIYDVLARSVSGDYLSQVYLQNREKLRMREADGAMAIIQKLDIKSIESLTPKDKGHIGIVAQWDVYGSVYHQQHVHYRCNTYSAEVVIKPVNDYWKIVKIILLDEQRVL